MACFSCGPSYAAMERGRQASFDESVCRPRRGGSTPGGATVDRTQAEAFAVHMLKFIRDQWPAAELVSLEVGRNDTSEVLWCKVHRTEEDPTHGGGHLFTAAYLDRVLAEKGG